MSNSSHFSFNIGDGLMILNIRQMSQIQDILCLIPGITLDFKCWTLDTYDKIFDT